MCINIYDIRLEDTQPACGMNWPPEMPHITKLLGVSIPLHLQFPLATFTSLQPFIATRRHQRIALNRTSRKLDRMSVRCPSRIQGKIHRISY